MPRVKKVGAAKAKNKRTAARGNSTTQRRYVSGPARTKRRGNASFASRSTDYAAKSKLGRNITVALFAIVLVFGLFAGGHVRDFLSAARASGEMMLAQAGFGIRSIEISGQSALTNREILSALAINPRRSMLSYDTNAAQKRLKKNLWVKDVQIMRLFPDRLQIILTEQKPFAVWQVNKKRYLLAKDGTKLKYLKSAQTDKRLAQTYPLVVGKGAGAKANELVALLKPYPDLKQNIKAALRIADRRWTLKLHQGPDILLPEKAEAEALAYLIKFFTPQDARFKRVAIIDLRLRDRVSLRMKENQMQPVQHKRQKQRLSFLPRRGA